MAEPVYLSGGRIQGRSDDSVLDSIPQTSWKELDRVTLSGTSDTMDTGTFTAKDNLMILAHIIRSGSVSVNMTFNADDSNGNYAGRLSETGESGDYIKSQGGYADYYPGWGWGGTLSLIDPKQGYKLRLENDSSRTFLNFSY